MKFISTGFKQEVQMLLLKYDFLIIALFTRWGYIHVNAIVTGFGKLEFVILQRLKGDCRNKYNEQK